MSLYGSMVILAIMSSATATIVGLIVRSQPPSTPPFIAAYTIGAVIYLGALLLAMAQMRPTSTHGGIDPRDLVYQWAESEFQPSKELVLAQLAVDYNDDIDTLREEVRKSSERLMGIFVVSVVQIAIWIILAFAVL